MKESLNILKRDRVFRGLIKKHGPPKLRRGKNYFEALVRSIVYQQLSGKAAETIFRRFLLLFKTKKFPTPKEVLSVPIAKLRSAGLSGQKASYIQDLAQKFSDGTIESKRLGIMTNEDVVEHLTKVKGIGVWTAHMFLIFTLGRRDILPVGDLGIRKGFQIVYKLKKLPDEKKMIQLSKPWREHASVASWYLWRVLD